jgi:hypothetical protein
MRRLIWIAVIMSAITAWAQTPPPIMTRYVGTVKDLTGTVVTSGRITWTLSNPSGGVISGTGAFVAATVSCLINASGTPVASSDSTSPCDIVNNTALTPTGTSYKICIQAYNASPGTCYNSFAIGGIIDISTIVPTPASQPYYGTPGGAQGPPGVAGPMGPPGGSLSYPGVVSDGSNGMMASSGGFTGQQIGAIRYASQYGDKSTNGIGNCLAGTGNTCIADPTYGLTEQPTWNSFPPGPNHLTDLRLNVTGNTYSDWTQASGAVPAQTLTCLNKLNNSRANCNQIYHMDTSTGFSLGSGGVQIGPANWHIDVANAGSHITYAAGISEATTWSHIKTGVGDNVVEYLYNFGWGGRISGSDEGTKAFAAQNNEYNYFYEGKVTGGAGTAPTLLTTTPVLTGTGSNPLGIAMPGSLQGVGQRIIDTTAGASYSGKFTNINTSGCAATSCSNVTVDFAVPVSNAWGTQTGNVLTPVKTECFYSASSLTSVANASAGSTTYTGTISSGSNNYLGSNACVVTITGFSNSANNGTFTASASTPTTITVSNAGGTSESASATESVVPFATIMPVSISTLGGTGFDATHAVCFDSQFHEFAKPATLVNATTITIPLRRAHAAGAWIMQGGACGYGGEATAYNVAGGAGETIRYLWDVIGSTATDTIQAVIYSGATVEQGLPPVGTGDYGSFNISNLSNSGTTVYGTYVSAGTFVSAAYSVLAKSSILIAGASDGLFNNTCTNLVFSNASQSPITFTCTIAGLSGTHTSATATASTNRNGLKLWPMAEVLDVQNHNAARTSNVTAWSNSANVATFTGANTFVVGQTVQLSGFTTGTFYNGQTIGLTSASPTSFSGTFTHANTSATESGLASSMIVDGTLTVESNPVLVVANNDLIEMPNHISAEFQGATIANNVHNAYTSFSDGLVVSYTGEGAVGTNTPTGNAVLALGSQPDSYYYGAGGNVNAPQLIKQGGGYDSFFVGEPPVTGGRSIFNFTPSTAQKTDPNYFYNLLSSPNLSGTDTIRVFPNTAKMDVNTPGILNLNALTLQWSNTVQSNMIVGDVLKFQALPKPVNSAFSTFSRSDCTLLDGISEYYTVYATNFTGSGVASTETFIPTGSTGSNTNCVVVNWPRIAGAVGYKVCGRSAGAEGLLFTTTSNADTLTWTDTGAATPGALCNQVDSSRAGTDSAAYAGIENPNGTTQTKLGPGAATTNITVALPAAAGTLALAASVATVSSCGTTSTCANTAVTSPRIVTGTVTLAGGTATVTGMSPAFASAASYVCTTNDTTTTPQATTVQNTSSSSITIKGNSTDVVTYICIGN